MGCFKLEAYRNREERSFRGVWKKSDQEKGVANYYPFGLRTSNSYSRENSVPNRYLYNGRELTTELGLEDYDYGARRYDPACGCWHSPDPHAENYLSTSPYVFALNNPVLLKDDNGKDIIITNLSTSQQKQLAQFAKTSEGRAFLSQFAVQGKEYNIGGEKFTFDVKQTSNHNIYYQTADLGAADGLTETYVYSPVKGKYVKTNEFSTKDAGYAAANKKGQFYNFAVFLDDNLSDERSLYTIGHESFVHADQNKKQLDQAFGDYKSGKLKQEAEASPIKGNTAENVLSSIIVSSAYGPDDHKFLVDGKVVKLENFVKELDKLFKTTKFSEQLKKDKKFHEDNPNR